MAKENTIQLFGYVTTEPKIKFTIDESGKEKYISGKLQVLTVRHTYATDDLLLRGKIRWDYPIVFTRNPDIITGVVQRIHAGDLIMVRGTLCSREVRKRFICPNCGHNMVKENGVIVYVDPISIHIFQQKVPEEEALETIKHCDEFSNDLRIIGTLCREPQFYEDAETRKKECQFQIASNRLRRIAEDGPDKRTDYPWVKVFGDKAEECYHALHTNSTIYIGGAIETRDIALEHVCEECGTAFTQPSISAEIIPYHVEYLNDCVLPEGTGEKDSGETE